MTDSTAIAVDLAFLLPARLSRALTDINRTLQPPPDGFRFDTTHLPHVTIVQQFVRRDALEQIGDAITSVLIGQRAHELVTTELSVGRVASTLRVALTAELAILHRLLVDCLTPFHGVTGGPDGFWTDGESPRPADVEWVTSFRHRSALTSFVPHITLGVGRVEAAMEPSRFLATELALCQLGRFCTCRRVLHAWMLTDPDR